MKFIILIVFSFYGISVVAQTTNNLSKLIPVSKDTKKFSKKTPKYLRDGYFKNYPVKFKVDLKTINLSETRTAIEINISTLGKFLAFQEKKDRNEARIRIYGRIFSLEKGVNNLDGYFEESLTVKIKKIDSKILNTRVVNLYKTFELPKGKYKLGLIFVNYTSGMEGRRLIKFRI